MAAATTESPKISQVSAEWDGRAWSWAGHYWGHRPPGVPKIVIGSDPDLVGTGWDTAAEAMQAVEQRHQSIRE